MAEPMQEEKHEKPKSKTRKCAMVFCDEKESASAHLRFVSIPPVGKRNLSPFKGPLTSTIVMTERDRRIILEATMRDDGWSSEHVHTSVRLCKDHVDPTTTDFALLPPYKDPIFRQWFFSTLAPGYVQEQPRSDEDKARWQLRDTYLRNGLVGDYPDEIRQFALAPQSLYHDSPPRATTAAASSSPSSSSSSPAQLALANAAREERRANRRRRTQSPEVTQPMAMEMDAPAEPQLDPLAVAHIQKLMKEYERQLSDRDRQLQKQQAELDKSTTLLEEMRLCPRPALSMDWLLEQENEVIRGHVGLPKTGLLLLLRLCENFNLAAALHKFDMRWQDMVLLTLYWLKIDPTFAVLCSTFNISSLSTVHDRVYGTLGCLAHILREYVKRHPITKPDQRTIELQQEKFARVRFVGDCTHVLVERPSHPEINKLLYSSYMSRHCGKVFVASDARGWPIFISPAYGGSFSDDAIVLACKDRFFPLFQPQDILMYDKGATKELREELAKGGIELLTPPIAHEKYLHFADREESRDISSARVLIENVNERAKRFRILTHVLPCNQLEYISAIVEVCFLLTVFMGPIRMPDPATET